MIRLVSGAARAALQALRDRGFVVFVIALLTALYALGLLVPQRATVGAPAWEAWREQSPRLVRALEVSGLADVYRAPGTYVALGFFFASLAAVIAERLPRLVRRTRLGHGLPLDPAALAPRKETSSVEAAAPGDAVARAASLLSGAGYRVHAPGGASVRAVRFRLAPLGFVLFHGAFALLLAGGIALDLTRFSGVAEVGVGEPFDARGDGYAERPRERRLGVRRPELSFIVTGVRPRSEQGHPMSLHVDLLLPGERSPRVANVNEPVNVGTTSVLSLSAGAMPLFTCDFEGAHDGAWVKIVPNASGRTQLLLEPCGLDVLARLADPEVAGASPREGQGVMLSTAGVSGLETVARTGVEVAVRGPDGAIATGVLRPGDSIATPDGRRVLHLPDLRYYAKLQIVDERGGSLLWAAFILGTVGLVLRLVLYRREIVVVADPERSRVLVATAADVVGWRPEALLPRIEGALRTSGAPGAGIRPPAA